MLAEIIVMHAGSCIVHCMIASCRQAWCARCTISIGVLRVYISVLSVSMLFFTVITIGFTRNEYTYFEPDEDILIMNVTIVKEASQLSEQQYSLNVTVSSPTTDGLHPAMLETAAEFGDYGLHGGSFRTLVFHPDQQEIVFLFSLFGDEMPEGVEAFRATISTVGGTPTFRAPTMALLTTTIRIMDNDSEL